jgi:cytochrome c-type biogenesis protein
VLQDLVLAFAAGLLSCASACVLPLLPAYVGYLGGVGVDHDGAPGAKSLRVIGRAALFVAGFGSAFVAMGALAGLVGAGVLAYRPLLARVAGAVLVVMGVALLGGVPWLMRERRLHFAHRLPRTPWAAYLIGLAFAVGWTPCVGPILAAVLLAAANRATAAQGALLLAAYALGMGLPFLGAAVFLSPVTRLIGRVRGAYPILSGAAAVLLIAMGALTLTDRLTLLNPYFPAFASAASADSLGRLSVAGPDEPVNRPEPAVKVRDLNGNLLSISSLRGHPVIVNFWATWCDPCRAELPVLSEAARSHSDQGVTLVAIDYRESPQAVKQFWSDLGLAGVPYLDPAGDAAGRFGVGLHTGGLPVTVFIDRKGVIRSFVLGQVDAARAETLMAAVT